MKIKNVMCAVLAISLIFTSFAGAIDFDNKELQTQMKNSSEKSESNESFSLLAELADYGLHLLFTGTLVSIGGAIGFYCGTSIGLKQGLGEGALDVGSKGMLEEVPWEL